MQNVDPEDEEVVLMTSEEAEDATDELRLIAKHGFATYTFCEIEDLLKRGGDPNAMPDLDHTTCLHRICYEFRDCDHSDERRLERGLAFLRLFLDQDSINVNLLDDFEKGIIHRMALDMKSPRFLDTFLLIMRERLANSDDVRNMTPKTLAEVVNLKTGENAEEPGTENQTALFQICAENNGRPTLLLRTRLLIEIGKADPNIGAPLLEVMKTKPPKNKPAPYQEKMVLALLRGGIKNINHLHDKEFTYLHMAITENCDPSVVRLLLEYGSDPSILTHGNDDDLPPEIKINALQLAEYGNKPLLAAKLREWHVMRLYIHKLLQTRLRKNQDTASRVRRKMRNLP
jgi:hypothetical protein